MPGVVDDPGCRLEREFLLEVEVSDEEDEGGGELGREVEDRTLVKDRGKVGEDETCGNSGVDSGLESGKERKFKGL